MRRCCLSEVTIATVTMATGWLLMLVMMSMMMTVWSGPIEGGKLGYKMSHGITMPQ